MCEKKVIIKEIVYPRCQHLLTCADIHDNYIVLFIVKRHIIKLLKKTKTDKRQKTTLSNFKLSALHKTWFARMHIDMAKVCRFIGYFLMINLPRHRFLIKELSNDTVVDWTNFCEVRKTIIILLIFVFYMKLKVNIYFYTQLIPS